MLARLVEEANIAVNSGLAASGAERTFRSGLRIKAMPHAEGIALRVWW